MHARVCAGMCHPKSAQCRRRGVLATGTNGFPDPQRIRQPGQMPSEDPCAWTRGLQGTWLDACSGWVCLGSLVCGNRVS